MGTPVMHKVRWKPLGTAAVLLGLGLLSAVRPAAGDEFADERQNMVRVIKTLDFLTPLMSGLDGIDDRILEVMGLVPRHEFIPGELRSRAYEDRPLPIGFGQTISQPYIVALMTDLLKVEADDVVLEVGTGSGYQAAVLAELVAEVYTIEIVPSLAERAVERLARLGYGNVTVRPGDGFYGWTEHAPFDAIIVTAAAGLIPPPLIEQLRPGGRMVIPVGAAFMIQHLMLVEKDADGEIHSEQVLPVRFVPLTGGH